MKNIFSSILLASSLILLSACGGGSSDGVNQGVFIDSAVQGIRYTTDTQSGTTDAAGRFKYKSGEAVSFFVGDVPLGIAQGEKTITPVELVPGATDETNPTVTNIARFLQTIDEDGDPSNGIVITETVANLATGVSVDFAQSTTGFGNDGAVQTLLSTMTAATTSGAKSMVSASSAQSHLSSSLLAALAGNWSGSFSGEDTGTWSATISSNGTITGSGNSSGSGAFTLSGNITTSGDAAFGAGGASTGASFNGVFDYTSGNASGSWDGGSWTGTKK